MNVIQAYAGDHFSAGGLSRMARTHFTFVSVCPDQKVRRMVSCMDYRVRNGVRLLFLQGLGEEGIYKGKGE